MGPTVTTLYAFLAGLAIGAGGTAWAGWHHLRAARAAWRAAETEEIAAKARCEDLADQLDNMGDPQ
jgi:hypothetical protein